MSFGKRLYELRKNKNISQEELAELLDVSRQSISKWEFLQYIAFINLVIELEHF